MIKRSEERVKCVITAMEKMANPFEFEIRDAPSPLINISSGVVLPNEQAGLLLRDKETGEKLQEDFIKEGGLGEKFWNRIPRVKTPTFTILNIPIKQSADTLHKKAITSHRNLFHKMVVVASKRDVDLKSILCHELCPVPLSIADLTGKMRKPNKSVLMHELSVSNQKEMPTSSLKTAYIIDLMAVVQSAIKGNLETFGELAEQLGKYIDHGFRVAACVVITPDRYDVIHYIKSFERARRQTSSSAERIIHSPETKLPVSLKSYLENSANKVHLVNSLLQYWESSYQTKLHIGTILILSLLDGTTVKVVSGSSEKLSLITDHEEADSKMFVFAKYTVDELGITRIVIKSPDTDVLVIACHYFCKSFDGCVEFWFETGVAKNKRFILVHSVCESFGASICQVLPAFHALTGCDSNGSFAGIGKKKSFNILKKNINNLIALNEFGNTPDLEPESDVMNDVVKFVCWLYDSTTNIFDIDKLRYKLFCQKNISSEKLPPTYDSLVQHARRDNYQTYIWVNASNAILNLPSPAGNGWENVDNKISPFFMTKESVPESVLELVTCKCRFGCVNNRCSCRKNGMECTDACSCHNFTECENDEYVEDDSSEGNSDSDSDDDLYI